ncbi:HIT family protein [Isoalcanivorax beigongshangi]|uniref:HIT family protein n=1 Tax=Isoalcanivorax beigongshangi TaxID=3238810 RepID=A0ABV4AK65_9GAMM
MTAALLHPRLEADTHAIGETSDMWLRWMDDQRFPWVIVVPKQHGVTEWYELPIESQHALLDMANRCGLYLKGLTGADKINIGALGNLVPQLHIHVIARRQDDACWPGPVWGQGEPQPYPTGQLPPWLPGLRERLSQRCA